MRIVCVAYGIGRAPFGDNVAERIKGLEDRVAECVGDGDAVAEHVVGISFRDDVRAVGVGVGGHEIAFGGIVEGLKRQKCCFPNGARCRDYAGEGVVAADGGRARGLRMFDCRVR